MTDRRTFLHGIAGLAIPTLAYAQATERMRRLAVLSGVSRRDWDASIKLIRPELEKLGWIEGRTILLLEPRTSDGRNDRSSALAEEIAALAPDVILAYTVPATRALMQTTSTVPIVTVGVGDPIAYGLARSYAEPGGNVTGAHFPAHESSSKTLELLKETQAHSVSMRWRRRSSAWRHGSSREYVERMGLTRRSTGRAAPGCSWRVSSRRAG